MQSDFDIAIIGGGLAGLSTAIRLGSLGHKVALFEKESYPFHKVCGEYISKESVPFLESIGISIAALQLPEVIKLEVSSPSGKLLKAQLDMGGIGISRFLLDSQMADIAKKHGVAIMDNCKVNDVIFKDNEFFISTNCGDYISKVCCGSFGKRSNLDVRWNRKFIQQHDKTSDNYIGVKYHISGTFDKETIRLHNFKNGYCGLSAIEDDKYCLCYLSHASNLKKSNNSITEMERTILSKNPHLAEIFSSLKKIEGPVSISQVTFQSKTLIHDHILLNGDAAGMIAPLCGNGMSMAMHGGKIMSECIHAFLSGQINRREMEIIYAKRWRKKFNYRLMIGRTIQRFFGKISTTEFFIAFLKTFPFLTKKLISLTHGKPF